MECFDKCIEEELTYLYPTSPKHFLSTLLQFDIHLNNSHIKTFHISLLSIWHTLLILSGYYVFAYINT